MTKDHPKLIQGKQKTPPFAREKKFLVMKEQLCFLKRTTSLMMGLFFSFEKKTLSQGPPPFLEGYSPQKLGWHVRVGLLPHIVQKVIYTNGRRFACERQMVSLIEEPSTLQGWTFKYKGKKKKEELVVHYGLTRHLKQLPFNMEVQGQLQQHMCVT